MKLTYETGTATLIQFITLSLLNIINGFNSSITICRKENTGECVESAVVSFVFFVLVVGWFGIIAALGYAAQSRRSKRLAQLLIMAELLVVGVAYINIHGHPDALSLAISLIDLMLAVWIIYLAFRLMRSGGKRITSSPRRRRRRLNP